MSDVRLAASVILLRSGDREPLELYMTRRSPKSTFVPDAFVFPGGAVDDVDRSEEAHRAIAGFDDASLTAEFRARIPEELPSSEAPIDLDGARALVAAALRELQEEAGICMADARNLALFSHWITPPSEPRRYNTHFFLAPAPPEQSPLADAYETHDGMWIAPSLALERYRSGNLYLVYPTIKHLERLLPFESVEAALSFARSKPILTIMPTGAREGGFALPPELENAW
jgi:8-oxo-dGTP pyrophosphatase MutT (NUDIX family)